MAALHPSNLTETTAEASLQLEPAQKRVLADEVADVLRAAIMDGRLAPGQQIREEQVATRMQVSRGPVREALARLEREGLVYKHRNRGTYVARLLLPDVEEVFSLRSALEALATRYFATNATPADFDQLEAILNRMRPDADPDATVQELTDLDIRFHECIVRAAGHRRLLETWLTLREQFRIVLLSRNAANQDYRELLYSDHRAVLDALRSGDLTRMLERSAFHIHQAYVRLLQAYAAPDSQGVPPDARCARPADRAGGGGC